MSDLMSNLPNPASGGTPPWLESMQSPPPGGDSVATEICAAEFELPAAAVRDSLEVTSGNQLFLSTSNTVETVLQPQLLETSNPDRFKAWIGVDDDTAARMESRSQVPLPPPLAASFRSTPLERLPAEIRQRVMAAAWHYFFRDSRTVSSYHRLIGELAPFAAALYPIRRLLIGPASSLVVSGLPARLVVDELVLEAGGTLQSFTITKGIVGRFEKRNAVAGVPVS